MKILRLILGDQLNSNHSWFKNVDEEVIYVMAEMRQETDNVKHHIQKVVGFFLAMRNFSESLKKKGHRVEYFKISDGKNPQNLQEIIQQLIQKHDLEKFEYQLPDEYRLDQQLKSISQQLSIPTEAYDSEHFYTSRDELGQFFKAKKQLLMESFYRMMRKKHNIMMVGDQPEGGKWNFDQSNRKKWDGEPKIPKELNFKKDVTELITEIEKAEVTTFGNIDPKNFNWPTTRKECQELLSFFCEKLVKHFGDYQDALHTEEKYLFHSRLSFAMNSKLLSPKEVIDTVLDHYYAHKGEINISQVEGFVRQILGWREYMRGVYWKKMPNYSKLNHLENHNPLPKFFWDGNTKMNCLKKAIGQSLDDAYAHHIQRLMVIGNFALLTQTNPDEVDAWYLGVYIDALEWVEITNTRGMSQYADGGLVATKPYVSSANYINKMGNYCKNCYYSHSKKIGKKACPLNALYWNFLHEKRPFFEENPRMGMMLRLLDKKDPEELNALSERAEKIIKNPDAF
ncbi:cryptochrome/photolyase family protein [Flagellimonas zhangzhouensis]|uniref:Deoxyribodipyrimidine photolyase-related protein n=1 Tax=Flagellimonas zhangzhouensis TaxID=1073328 RepID=A0A1H2YXW0_9FLAO|nr:cryptochrome/photolyase family protein [Allomuricauda zhangzhouensis]SDR05462.1 deoxyribodipyrimidine photolyase-related protein [Allomuricauda zhangzhouensis]SDX09399.1 deoxyribodipyrimidine photolyase-related protein [Allomuricauda zhangzhouensis]